MDKKMIIAVVGMCGSGKSVAVEIFEKFGWKRVYFGTITFEELKKRGMEINEANEKKIREEFRASGDKGIYAKLNEEKIKQNLKKGNVVIESMYSWSEYKYLKEKFKERFKVLCIVTNSQLRRDRLKNRDYRPFDEKTSLSRDYSEIENIEKGGPIGIADYYISNNTTVQAFKRKVTDFIKNIKF